MLQHQMSCKNERAGQHCQHHLHRQIHASTVQWCLFECCSKFVYCWGPTALDLWYHVSELLIFFFRKSDIKTCMTQISYVAMKDLQKRVGINKTNINKGLGLCTWDHFIQDLSVMARSVGCSWDCRDTQWQGEACSCISMEPWWRNSATGRR